LKTLSNRIGFFVFMDLTVFTGLVMN